MNEVSGIMIWELGQDRFDEYSLLDKIYEVIQMSVSTENELTDLSVEVFPHPFENQIKIQNEYPMNGHLFLTDANGRLILKGGRMFPDFFEFTFNNLPYGLYVTEIAVIYCLYYRF